MLYFCALELYLFKSNNGDFTPYYLIFSIALFSFLPLNWSIEQFKPKVWDNLMDGSVCTILFSVTSIEHQPGKMSTGLFIKIAVTVSSATYSGSRMGTT